MSDHTLAVAQSHAAPHQTGASARKARTITISSGGKKRDDALNPIIASVKRKLIALASEHGNRKVATGESHLSVANLSTDELVKLRAGLLKYSEDQPRDANGRWGEGAGPFRGLSMVETRALTDYTYTAYSQINRTLRGAALLAAVPPKETAKQIKAIDSAMSHSRLPVMTVLRGVGGFDSFSRDEVLKAPGTVVRDKGFLSTSKSAGFSSSLNNYRLVIDVPEGTHGIDLSSTINRAEAEVLLDRGLGLRVDSVTSRPITDDPYSVGESIYLIHATVVP